MKPNSPKNVSGSQPGSAERHSTPPIAFLLAQLGGHAAGLFARRLRELRLAPPHAGILNFLDRNPGITQQALAALLGIVPSGLVALLDEMEVRLLIERRINRNDRRRRSLYLSEEGRRTMHEIAEISRKHQRDLVAALSEDEQRQFGELLQRIADQQGLTRGVHPGYGRIARAKSADRPPVKRGNQGHNRNR